MELDEIDDFIREALETIRRGSGKYFIFSMPPYT